MVKTSTIVLVGGKVQQFERWIPQGNRAPRHVLSIARNPDSGFICTAPQIGSLGGTVTNHDLAQALHLIGIDVRFILTLVSLFEATALTRVMVTHEFPGYDVQSDEPIASHDSSQLTLGF